MSDSYFLTQVPYQTQTSIGGLGTDSETLSQAPLNAVSSAESRNSIPPSAQHVQRTLTDSGVSDKDVPNSSEESIECQPFTLPATNLRPLSSQVPTEAESHTESNLQPFSVLDQIKKLRTEAPKKWPTHRLKWARTISREQQAILAQDDSWSPPLPGRPRRPGTIPIRILTILTEKADQATLTPDVPSESGRQERSSSAKDKADHSISISRPSHKTALPQNDDQSDGDSEAATQHASQWSLSPQQVPHRQAPPDTSPLRESTFQHLSDMHLGTERRLTQEHEGSMASREHPKSSYGPGERQVMGDAPELGSSPPEEIRHGHDAEEVARDDQRDIALVTQRRPVQNKDVEIRRQSLSRKGTPRVQVKDTPFPRAILKPRQPQVTDDELPQSSFVGATYPHNSQISVAAQNKKTISTSPRQAGHRKTSETTSTQTQSQMEEHQHIPGSFVLRTEPAVRRLSASIAHEEHEDDIEYEQPPRKRIRRLPAEANRIDPDYAEIDQRRILERRTFRKSIPANPQPGGISPTGPTRNVDRQTVSRTSSPQHTDKRSHGLLSESGRTTATNFSMHKLAPDQQARHQYISATTVFNPRALASLLQQFQDAYSGYKGDGKALASAIRLIISLRSQPREPHPSLWDDFVYRKSDDYKLHLQYCIDEGENALPYQDFYHVHVRRPKQSQEVITERTIMSLYTEVTHMDDVQDRPVQSREKSVSAPRQGFLERLAVGSTGTPQRDVDKPAPDATSDAIHVDQPTNISIEDEPIEVAALKECNRPRKSLPWTGSQATQRQPSSSRNVISEAVASAPRSSASEKVEEWLNSSGPTAEESAEGPLTQIAPQVETLPPIAERQQLSTAKDVTTTGQGSGILLARTPARTRKTSTVAPESDMARFVRLYASLQSESRAVSSAGSQQAINVYTW